jgi:hypothetical protein
MSKLFSTQLKQGAKNELKKKDVIKIKKHNFTHPFSFGEYKN